MIIKNFDNPAARCVEDDLFRYIDEHPNLMITKAKVKYNPQEGLPMRDKYEDYPLQLIGIENGHEVILRVYSVTAYEQDVGTQAMTSILKRLEFKDVEKLSAPKSDNAIFEFYM